MEPSIVVSFFSQDVLDQNDGKCLQLDHRSYQVSVHCQLVGFRPTNVEIHEVCVQATSWLVRHNTHLPHEAWKESHVKGSPQ